MKSCILFLLLIIITESTAQTVQDAKNLRTYLFTTKAYDFRVRPVSNQSQPLEVYFVLNLLNIVSLDEVREVLHATTFLELTWNDAELGWNPTNYAGLKATHFPQNEVWKPDIVLKNSQNDLAQFGYPQQNVRVQYDGMVEWEPFVVLDATCSINVRYYPVDIQTCSLTFIAYSYTLSEVTLNSLGNGIDLEEYEPNPVWSILSTRYRIQSGDDDTKIVFTLRLQRKSLYTVVSVIFPILLLVILNICVFFVPSDSGEKSGYAVTIFLSFAVFLTLIESTMPPNSDSIALFSIYIIVMTTMSTIITVLTQIMIRCATFTTEKTKIPKWLIFLAKLGQLKMCRNKCCLKSGTEIKTIKEKIDDSVDGCEVYEPDNEELTVYSWKQAMNGLDCFLFVVFGSFALIFTLTFVCVCAFSA